MSQIDAFKNTFKCNLCNQLLERPIILSCGETICEKDLKTYFNNAKVFQCSLCEDEHQQPKKGFPPNKNIQKQLDLHVNQIDLSKNHSKYEECKEMCREIEEIIKETDLIGSDPESFVFSYFENLIIKVEIQREKLIEEINFYSEKTIEKIKEARDECLSANDKTNLFSADYETMKESVNQMNQELDSFDINDEKIEKLIKNFTIANVTALTELKRIQSVLLLQKSYKFEPVQSQNTNIKDLLGSFSKVVFIFILAHFNFS